MADEFYDDEQPECPLCMDPLAVDDLNFFPCSCRYQICRFCWHRIRTDENGLCPACREPYAEDPAEYTPPSQEQIAKLKSQKRQKSHDKKQKLVESRRTLADVRVVQKNLVFVIGLSSRLADPETLKRHDCFGKYGKIHKVVINHSTVYNGAQGPSVSAYVTYYRSEDAKKAIQNVNNAYIDGRFLKASFGTTKYCSHFLRGLQCPKPDCMYLHELGDEDASFTKQDMLLGKHQDYEQATLSAFSQAMNVSVTHKQHQPVREESHHRPAAASSNNNNSGGGGGWKRSQPPRMKQKAKNEQHQQQQQQSFHHHHHHQQQQQEQQQQVYDAESALPSSALWAKESEGFRQPSKHNKHLQRTHSHPVTTHTHHRNSHAHSNPNSRRGSKGSDGSRDDTSSSSGSKLGSPAESFSSSIESLKNLTVSGEWSAPPPDQRIEEYHDEEEVFTSHDDVVNKRDESTSGVLHNFGSAMSGGFGGLGVSWHGQVPVASTTIQEEPSWDTTRRAKGGGDNEQKRMASAAYVNYGPTTNNVLAELTAKQHDQQHGSGGVGGHSMLQSTLDDKFNSIYTMPSAFPQQQQQIATNTGWTPFTRPQDHGASIPPPPGFAPQSREPVKTIEPSMAAAVPTGSSRYSLWGSNTTTAEQQQQRVIPGAIQHSVLEASLFSNWSQNYYPSYLAATPQAPVANGFNHHQQQHQQQQSTGHYLPWNGLSGLHGLLTGDESSTGTANIRMRQY